MKAHDDTQQALEPVPEFMVQVPAESRDVEWALYRDAHSEDAPVPSRYRELIGLAVAETEGCRSCVLYHSELARLCGASEKEIDDAVQLAANLSGRPPCTLGAGRDSESFRREIALVVAHVMRQQIAPRRQVLQSDPGTEAATEANRRLGQEAYDALNAGSLDRLAALVAEDAPMTNAATGELFAGAGGYRVLMGRWLTGFPDLRAHLERITAGPAAVVIESTWTGTHRGPLEVPPHTIPPTGRTMTLPFCEVMRAKGGRIIGRVLYFDLQALHTQLGAS